MSLPMKEHLARIQYIAAMAFVHGHLPDRDKRSITQDNREHRGRAPNGSRAGLYAPLVLLPALRERD